MAAVDADRASIHAGTWRRVAAELSDSLARNSQTELRVADVGAGLLSMLELVLSGSGGDGGGDGRGRSHGDREGRLPSLLATLRQNGVELEEVHYYAYEPNRALEPECVKVLQSLGFSLQVKTENDDGDQLELVFVRRAKQPAGQPRCTVYLRCGVMWCECVRACVCGVCAWRAPPASEKAMGGGSGGGCVAVAVVCPRRRCALER